MSLIHDQVLIWSKLVSQALTAVTDIN
jgi:hypothetical protein